MSKSLAVAEKTIDAKPFETVRNLAGGYVLPRCLHVVAKIGVADVLDDSPMTAAELAEATGANPDALARILRLLSAHGIFEARDGRISHSPASRLLRSDHPQSMRALAQMLGFDVCWATLEHLEQSVLSGEPAAKQVLPGGFWNYLEEHPEEGRVFDAAMTAKATAQIAGIVQACDFSRFGLIADIGGGRGHLLQAVLDRVPAAEGVLFDLPHVVRAAEGAASERLKLQPGDFFKDALPACDAYILMEIIHDWNDGDARQILGSVRRAAPRHARLLLIESIVPGTPGPDWSKVLDVLMLTLLGGRQRTLGEYRALLSSAGFRFEREIKASPDISILEASVV